MHHTPSPWTPARDGTGELALWDEQDRHLFSSEGDSPLPIRQRVANVRLAAMAPRLLEALHYLLEQTVDQDLNHGIELTEGEEDARMQALAIFAELATPTALDAEADLIGDEEEDEDDMECAQCTTGTCAWCQAEKAARKLPVTPPTTITCTCHLKSKVAGPVPHCCPRHDGDYSTFLAAHNCD